MPDLAVLRVGTYCSIGSFSEGFSSNREKGHEKKNSLKILTACTGVYVRGTKRNLNGSSEKRVSKEASDEISLYRLLRKRYGTHPQRMIPRNDFRGLFPTKISLYWRLRTRYGTSPNGAFPRNDFEGCFPIKIFVVPASTYTLGRSESSTGELAKPKFRCTGVYIRG